MDRQLSEDKNCGNESDVSDELLKPLQHTPTSARSCLIKIKDRAMRLIIGRLLLLLLTCNAFAQDGFKNLGIAAQVNESKGVVATVDDLGNPILVAQASNFALVTDLNTGETVQVPTPPDTPIPGSGTFGSVLAANRKHYLGRGNHLVEFDPTRREWTFSAVVSPVDSNYIGVSEGPEGIIWAGGYPHAHLVSFDYNTREVIDHGQMDPAEQYIRYIAADDAGWVYMGIGTARSNIVAYNPTTKERRQLVPEDARVTGHALVRACDDGKVYGRNDTQWYRLYEGNAEPIEAEEAGKAKDVGSMYFADVRGQLPDGRQVRNYSMPNRYFELYDPDTKESREITFDYTSEGANVTSLAKGPEDIVYGSTSHPMRFVRYDPHNNELTDMGGIKQVGGGNFCAITTVGNLVIGAEYAGGRLWAYDVTKPWNPDANTQVRGIRAAKLAEEGQCNDGHFTYLANHDVAFLCGDKFGAEGTFTLNAPRDGQYYLHIQPLKSKGYCSIQYLLDGKQIGEPYDGAATDTSLGELQVFGPIELATGKHQLTMRTLPTEGQNPWGSVMAVELCEEKLQRLVEDAEANPKMLARWASDITRPRTALAHPDGKHVMMAGFAGYGLAGGGIGIYNLETGEETLLTAAENLLPSQSCITLKTLPNGDLIGGTSVSAPGGGHSTATEAELFIIDWPTKKLTFHTVPAPGETNIISIEVGPNGMVYGLTSRATFFVFDPTSGQITHTENWSKYGGVPRHALHWGPDGNLYAMLSKAIVKLTPDSLAHEKLADTPTNISAGGTLINSQLIFASGSSLWAYQIPGL